MMLSQDNRTTTTLTADTRTSPAMLTQDSKTTLGNLWTASMFPWTLDFPWLWQGNGQLLISDIRH